MAAAVGGAVASSAGLAAVAPGGLLRCAAVELPLRYNDLPTEADLLRTRDSDDFFAPAMLPAGCAGDNSAYGPRAIQSKVSNTHYLHAEWAEAMLAAMPLPQVMI